MPLGKAEIQEFIPPGKIELIEEPQPHSSSLILLRADCEAQIKGFPDAKYKKFPSLPAAEQFLNGAAPSHTDEASSSDVKGKKRSFGPEIQDVSGWDIVYSDGACKGNGKAGSVAGIGVWWGSNDPRQVI